MNNAFEVISEKFQIIKQSCGKGFQFLKKNSKFIRNKYFITVTAFVVWVAFFDENSVLSDLRYKSEIKQLQTKIEMYKKDIEESKRRSNELRTNNENLEKFAREQYKMKKTKEDIFIIE